MATYFIGDIQGCFDEFQLLLKKISFNPQCDNIYLVGDLIGRGPKALETLDFLLSHQQSIHPVLGNHDLHFLAISQGIKNAKSSDKYDALLVSDKLDQYIDYLRHLPLLIHLKTKKITVSHAGLSPQCDLDTSMNEANNVHKWLLSDTFKSLLAAMYDNSINDWSRCSTPLQRAIFTINSLTRMRYCYSDGTLEFSTNCAPHNNTNSAIAPWYTLDKTHDITQCLVFGHWASLMGKTKDLHAIALDTGCIWGHHLTAWNCDTNEYFQQISLQ